MKEIVGAQGGLLVCSSLEMSSPLTSDPEPSERFLVQSVLDFQGFASASSSFLFRSETLLSLLISFLPTITLFSVRVTHTHTHTHSLLETVLSLLISFLPTIILFSVRVITCPVIYASSSSSWQIVTAVRDEGNGLSLCERLS